MDKVGIKVLPDIVNVVLMIGLAGIGAESMFTASRLQTALARMGMFPAVLGKVDSLGRPIYSNICCCIIVIVLTYINCSTKGAIAFTWFSSVSATTTFFAWLTIAITNVCMRRALKAQQDPALEVKHAFRVSYFPLIPVLLFGCTLFTLACTMYSAVSPIDSRPSATCFFEEMLTMPLLLICFFACKSHSFAGVESYLVAS